MERLWVRSLFIVLLVFVFGCGGIKYRDVPINDSLPPAWKVRTIYPDGAQYYDLCDLV